jgi:hypothetical protein
VHLRSEARNGGGGWREQKKEDFETHRQNFFVTDGHIADRLLFCRISYFPIGKHLQQLWLIVLVFRGHDYNQWFRLLSSFL